MTGQATDGPAPDGMVANSRRAFTAPDLSERVAIGATPYTSVAAAHARFLLRKRHSAGPRQSKASIAGADEALRYTCVNCGGTIELRIGTIVARVSIEPDSGPAPHAELLSAIATVYAQRIEQALAGQPPPPRPSASGRTNPQPTRSSADPASRTPTGPDPARADPI